ncbi:calcium-binding protein P-like [Periplaneta americana]|uniref:calcium-binding protein P-like n=1 Tax=Periplaneta americana TaxID=6978 RepID=UPI0037E77DFE
MAVLVALVCVCATLAAAYDENPYAQTKQGNDYSTEKKNLTAAYFQNRALPGYYPSVQGYYPSVPGYYPSVPGDYDQSRQGDYPYRQGNYPGYNQQQYVPQYPGYSPKSAPTYPFGYPAGNTQQAKQKGAQTPRYPYGTLDYLRQRNVGCGTSAGPCYPSRGPQDYYAQQPYQGYQPQKF